MNHRVLYNFAVKSSRQCIELERTYGCNNYAPLPVVLARGLGAKVWDQEGKEYIDFMAAIGSVNQGHCHPRLIKAATTQMSFLTQVARITHHNKLGELQEYVNEVFGFDKSYFAQNGVDATEAACLMARRWAYDVKGVKDGRARILFPHKTFWGRSIAARAGSDDPLRLNRFGPFGDLGFDLIDYNSIEALENVVYKLQDQQALKQDDQICAYMVEPILGEGGIIYPNQGYLHKVRQVCDQYKILLIIDEVQTGLGRTGKMFGYDWENIRPDMITLGKSLSGGFYPISAVLGSSKIFNLIKPGEMGTTYGGNPLACAIAKEAISIIIDEKLVSNSLLMGEKLLLGLQRFRLHKYVKEIRGRGLFLAIEFGNEAKPGFGWHFSMKLLENGIVTRPSQKDMVIRIAPPLCISEEEIDQSLSIIEKTFNHFDSI